MVDDPGAVGPAYAGSGDPAVQLGEDVLNLLAEEHGKVLAVLDETVAYYNAGEPDIGRTRFGAVVRELREHLAASRQVLWPAVPVEDDADLLEQRAVELDLDRRLAEVDELDPEVSEDAVRELAASAWGVLRGRERTLMMALAALPPDERIELGDDLQEVAG